MSFGLLLLLLISADGVTNAAPADLLSFMADYSQMVLHADRADAEAEAKLDFWKGGDEAANLEATEYLRARGLLSEIEPGTGRVFFLRVLTEAEMKEVFHFKIEVADPALQQAVASPFFRYALVRLVAVDREGFADAEALGLEAGKGPSVSDLKERVAAIVAAAPQPEAPAVSSNESATVADPVPAP